MRLREHPVIGSAQKIFIPENTMGMMGFNLQSYVRSYEDVITMYEKPGGKPGINKTHQVTESYIFFLNQMLATKSILFDMDLFTVSRNKTVTMMKETLRDQLERFHEEFKAPKDNFTRGKKVQTGKMGSKQDDVAVALQQLIYWARAYLNNSRRAPIQSYLF